MSLLKNDKGFTLMELMVVLSVLVILGTIVKDNTNNTPTLINTNSSAIMSSLVAVESSLNDYFNVHNTYPTAMDDSTFVPAFCTPPRVITGFDTTYGSNGILFANQTGQPAGQNGHYIAMRATVKGGQSIIWNAIVAAASKMPLYKCYYNTSAPANTNMAAPGGTTTVYLTCWIDPN